MTKRQRMVVVDSAANILTALDKLNEGECDEASEVLVKTIQALQNLAKDVE